MFKVVDVFKVNGRISVTLEGDSSKLRSDSVLVDKNGVEYPIASIAMVGYHNPKDIMNYTTVILDTSYIRKGITLSLLETKC